MPRYTQRKFQLGEWHLWQRSDSPAYYRARFDRATGRYQRASLGTNDFEHAKHLLEEWWLLTRAVRQEAAQDASLADILRRYFDNHAKHLPSASGNRDALKKWLDYWQEASIGDLSVERQDAFVTHLQQLGLKLSTIQRTLNIGRAAISRAFKRGEPAAMPFVVSVSVKGHPPKGRPMEVAELSQLYDASAPHVRTFIRWMLGTAARPEPILQLRSEQVEWSHGIIRLNPEGREQNKKYRPVARLPRTLAGEVFAGWLVTHRDGEPVERIGRAWRAAVRRSGLTGAVRPYSLRHTAARWMRLHGVSAEEVAQQLGHRRLGVTGVYTEYDPEYLKAACGALDTLLAAVLPKNYPVGGGGNEENQVKSRVGCRSSVVEHSLGKGSLAIVRDRNRGRVPGPTGRHWHTSALLGSPQRRNSILNNELYIGQIVYNRQRFLKDPATGKRISRENPEKEWQRQCAPELRIIDDSTWDTVRRERPCRPARHWTVGGLPRRGADAGRRGSIGSIGMLLLDRAPPQRQRVQGPARPAPVALRSLSLRAVGASLSPASRERRDRTHVGNQP